MNISRSNSLGLGIALVGLLAFLFTNVFVYPHFVQNATGWEPSVFIVIFALWKIGSRLLHRDEYNKHFFTLGYFIGGPLLSLTIIILDITERMTHVNFIFSKLHLHPTELPFFYLLFLLLLALHIDWSILRKRGKWAVLVAPIYFYPIILLRFYNPSFNEWLKAENSLVEQLQFFSYGISAVLCYRLFRITQGNKKIVGHSIPILFLLMTVFFTLITLEEISWGQRLFQLEVPENIAQYNTQEELNIHNNRNIFPYVYYAYGTLSFLAGASWIFVQIIPGLKALLTKRTWLRFIPPWYLSTFFLVNFLYVVIRFNRWHPAIDYMHEKLYHNLEAFWEWEEYSEGFLAVGLFLFVLTLFHHYRKHI